MKIGFGYDVHRLVKGRKLILGGVEIPFEKGLDGHSDADVLVHAVIDALLGAMGEGDIGKHFPNTDPQYKDISSLELLRQVKELCHRKGFKVGNIDSTVVTENPKLAPYVMKMEETMAKVLGTSPSQISVKSKTTEGLGFTGTGEGIAAYAVCLLD